MKTLSALWKIAFLSVFVSTLHAQVLIKFDNQSLGVNFKLKNTSTGVGVVPTTNANIYTGPNLVSAASFQDAVGATSGTITFAAPAGDVGFGSSGFSSGANYALTLDGIGDSTTPATITLSSISSEFSAGYDLYVYASAKTSGVSQTISIVDPSSMANLATPQTDTSNVNASSGFVAGANYVKFTGLTATSLQIIGTSTGANVGIAGLEIVSDPVAGVTVPEPSTYVTLVAGILMLGLVVRRRRA